MNERKEILGIRVDCLSAKETMVRTMQFMENVPVDTIEIITMEALMNCHGDETWMAYAEKQGMILPGDPEILDALGIEDAGMRKEVRNRTFLKLFARYLQKNRKRVFFLAPDESGLEKVMDLLCRSGREMRIAGRAFLNEADCREEEVVNEINGTETDCVISVLPSPYQELFIGRNQSLMDAKLWIGCGKLTADVQEAGLFERGIRLLQKYMFRWQVEKQQKNN